LAADGARFKSSCAVAVSTRLLQAKRRADAVKHDVDEEVPDELADVERHRGVAKKPGSATEATTRSN
jgi:hypothetical protein